jgi:hypothetical protein
MSPIAPMNPYLISGLMPMQFLLIQGKGSNIFE